MDKRSSISIGKKVTLKYLVAFSMPTIISMLLMSIFGIIDGIFVARFISPIAMSAVNVVYPLFLFAMSIGFMLSTGGNALIAKKIGEGHHQEARENFTLITLTSFAISALMIVGVFFPDYILRVLGTDQVIYMMALDYLQPLLYFMPFTMLGILFQQFFITEGKAHIIMITTLVGGLLNIVLNYILIYVLQMGLRGAAIATSIGYSLPAIIGLVYFSLKRNSILFFVKPKFDFSVLVKASTNGSSEMVTMLAASVKAVLMNNILISIHGAEAVAAAGIMSYSMAILEALFSGYFSGISPIISFNYGKKDASNQKRIFTFSLLIIGIMSALSVIIGLFFPDIIVKVFVSQNDIVYDLAVTGFRLFSICFLFMGFSLFGTTLFTALNNGKISAILSFLRFIFFVVLIMILSSKFGLTGAWLTQPATYLLSFLMTVYYIVKMKRIYKYL